MGQSLIPFLIGLFFGHLYIYIKDVLTAKYRKDYLATPRFLYAWNNLVLTLCKNTLLSKLEDQEQQEPIYIKKLILKDASSKDKELDSVDTQLTILFTTS